MICARPLLWKKQFLAAIPSSTSGCDYRLWVRDPAEMYRSNVEGTRAILEAARKNGVRCVVYTSSVATDRLHR